MKMFINIFSVVALLFLSGCSSNQLGLAISTINKIEPLYNKEDSLLYSKRTDETQKHEDSCKKYNLYCTSHFPELLPEYKGGITNFRVAVYNSITIPKSSKLSKYTVNFILGRNDSIDSFSISGSTDKRMRREIVKAMKNDTVWRQNWRSGSFFGYKIRYEYEFDIELYKKK